MEKIRALLREGKRGEAGRLAMREFVSEKGYGKPDFGAYQPFCEVRLDFGNAPRPVENYRRELDLDTALARVAYRAGLRIQQSQALSRSFSKARRPYAYRISKDS